MGGIRIPASAQGTNPGGVTLLDNTNLRKLVRILWIVSVALVGSIALRADAGSKIDFSFEDDGVTPLLNGQMIDQNEEFGILFEILSGGPNAGAAIFDSTPGVNPADPDLWVDLGNLLILQSDSGNDDASTGDFFNNPNDDADHNNFLYFNFFNTVMLQAVDLVDVDQNGPVTVTLTDVMGRIRTYFVPASWTYEVNAQNLPPGGKGYDTLDLTTLADQPGEGGSIATATEDDGFNANSVIQLRLELDGSGGVDNLVFVPEPSSAWLIAVSMLTLIRRRRCQRL
jgi:hypothetical protein